jgi:hypothetical protein
MLEISKVLQLLFFFFCRVVEEKDRQQTTPRKFRNCTCWTLIKQLTKCHFQMEAFDRLFWWVGKFKTGIHLRQPKCRRCVVLKWCLEIFICGCEWMNCVNPKKCWMWGKRCQITRRLYIIKNCGRQKLIYWVLFHVLGVFCLFAGLFYLIFALQLSWVGVGDGASW